MAGKTAFRKTKNRSTTVVANDGSLNNVTDPVTFNVTAGGGALFPAAFPFYVTVENEILKVTNRVVDALTAARAQEGTVNAVHSNGVAVELRATAGLVDEITAAVNAAEDGQGNSFQTKVLTVVGDTIPITSRIVKLNNTSAGSLTLTSAPTLANGVDGQRIQLINIGVDDVVIQDQGTLANSNLRLTGNTLTFSTRDNVELEYDADIGDWVQVGPLVNVL